ncbi:hypothetical protein LshimejAT787_2001110 [Lyophyllum shimeji]|uniref:Uncharacterized protein n=1 Tax=Lyophyllum shimeji TaxID=47721 RepID=A0A9P3UWK7_LYOSH|nr:hypothetical protein LshimejAT787_2001110 [Lyophyllum shimeji]
MSTYGVCDVCPHITLSDYFLEETPSPRKPVTLTCRATYCIPVMRKPRALGRGNALLYAKHSRETSLAPCFRSMSSTAVRAQLTVTYSAAEESALRLSQGLVTRAGIQAVKAPLDVDEN